MGGLTRNKTGPPLTNTEGSQRTVQDFLMVEPWIDDAAYETGANNATTDTKIAGARLSLGSVFDFFTNTSVALRSSTDDIIRDVSTWPIIALALASVGLFPSDLPQESLADRVVVEKAHEP